MRKLISKLSVVVLAAAGACVPGTSPIHIIGTFPPETDMGKCKIDGLVGQTFGRLDASGGGDYLTVLSVDSELNGDKQIQSNQGTNLTGPDKRMFIVDAVALTYKSTNPVIQFDPEQIAISAQVPANSMDSRIATDIIGDKAADKMRNMLSDPMQVTQLQVSVSLKGHLNSGESVVSNTIVYPIEVRPSNTPCAIPGYVQRTGPCGVRGGQDGTAVTCCMTAPDPACD